MYRRFPTTPVSAEECQRRLQTSSSRKWVQLMLEPEDSWQELCFQDFFHAVYFSYELVWVTDDVFVVSRCTTMEDLLQGCTYEIMMSIGGLQVFAVHGGSSREVALAFLINFAVRTSYFVRIVGENDQELPLSEALMTAMVASGTVEHLELQNCHLNGAQSRVLALASTLRSLRFVKCTLSNNGGEFVEAMSMNQTLQALPIDDKTNIDRVSLGHCLHSNTRSVKELSFEGWNVEESPRLCPVFQGVAENQSIRKLYLTETKMDTDTWMAMCQFLATNDCLETLGLRKTLRSHAGLSNADVFNRARALVTLLESNTNIRELYFDEYIDEEDDAHDLRALYRSIHYRLELNQFRARIDDMNRSGNRLREFARVVYRVTFRKEALRDKTKLYLLLRENVDLFASAMWLDVRPRGPSYILAELD